MKKTARPSKKTVSLLIYSPVLSLIFASQAFAVTANEAPPTSWSGHTYGLSYSGEYFMSSANYGQSGGSYAGLPNGSSFTTFESHLRARYNLNSQASLFGGTGFATVRAVDNVYNNNKTNTSVTDIFIGGDYELTKKYLHVVPELMTGYPIDHTDPNAFAPLTSDGVAYVRAGAFVFKPFKNWRLGTYLGVNQPLEALATRVLYEATFDMRLFSIFSWGFGVDGYQAVFSDSTSFANRFTTQQKADATSERFYSYNPALTEARAWIGYRPDKSFWLRIGYAQTLNGVNTAQGQSVLLSIAYNPSGSSSGGGTTRASKVDPDRAMRGFEPDIESTEQGIFEEQEEETEGAGPRVHKAVSPPKAREKSNDNLDSTEKMLEKKTKDPQNNE
jgi:hypothetical protein